MAHVIGTSCAFAAVRADGSVVTWGHRGGGGDSSAVRDQFRSGVVPATANCTASAAVKEDCSVVTWGHRSGGGGDSSAVRDQLSGGVAQVTANSPASAAVKEDKCLCHEQCHDQVDIAMNSVMTRSLYRAN